MWKDGYRGIIVDLTVEEFHTESQERGPRKQRFEQKLKLGRCDDKKAQKKLGRGDDKKTQKKPCGDDKKTQKKPKKPRSGETRGTLWCGEMQNGEKLKVAVRPDRLLPDGSRLRLCSLYITPASSSKFQQVCQLDYSKYGEEQHPIVEDVMKTLALEFSTGSVLKQDLSKRRNAIMLLKGLPLTTKRPNAASKKRPNAASKKRPKAAAAASASKARPSTAAEAASTAAATAAEADDESSDFCQPGRSMGEALLSGLKDLLARG